MSDHDALLVARKERLDWMTADLFYGFEMVSLDEASVEANLWQGSFIPHKMIRVNELRELLGLPELQGIIETKR